MSPEVTSTDPPQLVEHFFRHESANLIAVLTRAFGVRYLDLVEDKVQEALLAAFQSWRQRGIPEAQARALLTEAFVAEALEGASEGVREAMLDAARSFLTETVR